ncbi:MAG: hypothetical protein R3F14_37880 [Polyangiaceae bacterium]
METPGGAAIRIEIDQVGREWEAKKETQHEWVECGRRVQARGFRVRTSEGGSVLVIPGEDVKLVHCLETEELDLQGAVRRRLRVAELANGDEVWVNGVLAQEEPKLGGGAAAYRAGPGAWVMRGKQGERMEVTPGARLQQIEHWRAFYRKALGWLGILAAGIQIGLFGPYYALAAFGEVETAVTTGASNVTTKSKGNTRTHYVLQGVIHREGQEQVPVSDTVDFETYRRAVNGELPRVPFLVVRALPAIHMLGEQAVLPIWKALAGVIGSCVGLGVLLWMRRETVPWFERKKVVEGSSGSLESKAWWAREPRAMPWGLVPRPSRGTGVGRRTGGSRGGD